MTKMNKMQKKEREMIKFLTGHFRYNTMSPWNNSTSYAVNIKIHNREELKGIENAYEMLEYGEVFGMIGWVLTDFAERHNYEYQIGINGRSGGYAVLYRGYKKPSEYKSVCTKCGQQNFKTIEESNNVCGRCGDKTRVNHKLYDIGTYPGKSIGSDGISYYEDWEIEELEREVELVKDFDRTVKDYVQAFADFCKENEIVETEELIPTKVKVIRAK